mmetsp:Transcript_55073/g.101955  ORF Transcript_55073/g.101955 Transcript_55073/m.101955 type:complete len:165 (-) Transcript_55073:44-538(-)
MMLAVVMSLLVGHASGLLYGETSGFLQSGLTLEQHNMSAYVDLQAANGGLQLARPSEPCGTAADGVTEVGPSRNGYCADAHSDTHAVCVTLPEDFCKVTGQSDWCSQYKGGPWCVCMWAYATYVDAKGCGSIAVNAAASDVPGVCAHSSDGGRHLGAAHQCLSC